MDLRCPLCDSAVVSHAKEVKTSPSIWVDGGEFDPVLAGIPTMIKDMDRVIAFVLSPCGCRLSIDEWMLCVHPDRAWFAHPDDVERFIADLRKNA